MAPHPTAGPGPREARAAGRGARDCSRAVQGCGMSPLPPTRPLSHARTRHVTASPDLPLGANSQGFEGESLPGLLRSCVESALHVFAHGVCSEPVSHLSPVPCAWVTATPARTGVSSSVPASPCPCWPAEGSRSPASAGVLVCLGVERRRVGKEERREGHPRNRGPPTGTEALLSCRAFLGTPTRTAWCATGCGRPWKPGTCASSPPPGTATAASGCAWRCTDAHSVSAGAASGSCLGSRGPWPKFRDCWRLFSNSLTRTWILLCIVVKLEMKPSGCSWIF